MSASELVLDEIVAFAVERVRGTGVQAAVVLWCAGLPNGMQSVAIGSDAPRRPAEVAAALEFAGWAITETPTEGEQAEGATMKFLGRRLQAKAGGSTDMAELEKHMEPEIGGALSGLVLAYWPLLQARLSKEEIKAEFGRTLDQACDRAEQQFFGFKVSQAQQSGRIGGAGKA